MCKVINSLLLPVILIFFGSTTFGQSKAISVKEIRSLTKEASKSMHANNFGKSLMISRKALRYATAIKNNNLISISYNIIGANHNYLAEFDKAILYYKKGLISSTKINNDTIKYQLNNNLGNTYYFEKKQYQVGIDYYKKSLIYSQSIADTSAVLLIKLNLTWAYFDSKQFKEGSQYLQFLNKYHSKFGDSSTVVVLNMLNGMFYGNKGENHKAESFFLNAIRLGEKGEEKSDLSFSHHEYSKFLFKNGEFEKAYKNLEIYYKISDEIYNKAKLEKANIVGLNLELDEYKREIDKIENQNKLQEQSIKKSKIILLLLYVILGVLLLLLYSLYRNDRYKKKLNAELVTTNELLVAAKDEAIEASKLKSQFVSTISHELRTPLYGVVGITNLILEEHKDLADSPHLSSLKFSARYLLSLVNDVLQINKIEENRIVLENLTFNISDEMSMIKNSLSFLAKNNENELTLEIDPAIPESLIGDKLRFSQILMNLVSNALKFTKKGQVKIMADLIKVEGKSHHIKFQIKDNGPGISESDQTKIFDKFVQIGRNNTDYQGTGLGLSIVKKMLTLFNSSITVESKIGEGSNFIFTIAFDYDPQKTIEIINNIQVDLTEKKAYKVLVVEDNKINQIVTQKILKKNNYFCVLADDGFQAIEIVENESFDIILMDINMPVMNGFETSRKIRLKGITTPIIALTAFTKSEIMEESISAGMNDIMIKPFEQVQLFQVINDQIYKSKKAIDL
jgi:signal transduction histidine kinase/ActR/RegA family two-component response regulator